MSRPLAIVFLAGLFVAAGLAESPDRWVEQLGDPQYRQREAAMRELRLLGPQASDAVRQGRRHPDPEIAARCRLLLPELLESDRERRVQLLLADRPSGLPMADIYLRRIGRDLPAREFYVQMLRREPTLWEEERFSDEPERVRMQLRSRATEVYERLYRHPPASENRDQDFLSTAAILLYVTTQSIELTRDDWPIHLLYAHPDFASVCRRTGNGQLYRRILGAFLEGRVNDYTIANTGHLIATAPIAEARPGILQALEKKAFQQPWTLATAISTLAHIGNVECVPYLERYLDDRREVQRLIIDGRLGSVQVRDVALAVSLHLQGQKPSEYGFEWQLSPTSLLNYYHLGFADESSREAAFRKRKAR